VAARWADRTDVLPAGGQGRHGYGPSRRARGRRAVGPRLVSGHGQARGGARPTRSGTAAALA